MASFQAGPIPAYPGSLPVHPNNLGSPMVDMHEEGYPGFAYFLSECPRYLHLRRFSALAVRSLLYRQHELQTIETKLFALEKSDANSQDVETRRYCRNYASLKSVPLCPGGQENVQHRLYEDLKTEIKEYEEALLRFDQLGRKSHDSRQLRIVQWRLERLRGPLRGVDAAIWGETDVPQSHASDLIQVIYQPKLSVLGNFFRNAVLSWSPRLPEWLYLCLFWSRRPKFTHEGLQFQHSHQAFELASEAFGNIVTSVIVYAAVTCLYFADGKTAGLAAVLLIAIAITACSVLFCNHQFVSMIATVCAVLVALLLGNSNPGKTSASSTTQS